MSSTPFHHFPPESFTAPPRGTARPDGDGNGNGDNGNDNRPKSSSLYLCVPTSLPANDRRRERSELTFSQVHVPVDPFLAFGGLDCHSPSIVPAQEEVSVTAAKPVRRDLPPAWRRVREEELWSKTETLGYLDEAGRRQEGFGE